MTKTTGFDEWSKTRISIGKGCKYNCPYCFVKHSAEKRFKWKLDFGNFELDQKKVDKKYQLRNHQPVICFNGHDIWPEILPEVEIVFKKLLQSGNQVLIVSKANFEVFKKLALAFKNYKHQLEFRITFTTPFQINTDKYEPNAPVPSDRLFSIKLMQSMGYKTSVSIEPFLSDPYLTIYKYLPENLDSYWVGPMNNVPILTKDKYLQQLYSQENLMSYYKKLKKLQKLNYNIKFKDGFLNQISSKTEV